MTAPELTLRLRAAIQPTHDRIESLPLTLALADGRTGRPTYAALLSQLLAVHEPLEAALADRPHLAAVYRPEMARAGLLRHDLAAFADAPSPVLPPTAALVERVHSWAAGGGWALAGPLYVFEGSRLGSMILAKRLAECFGVEPLPGRGLDYHMDHMPERPRLWQQFKAALNALPADAADDVVAAAGETMAAVHDIYAAVLPPAGALAGAGR